MIKVVYDIKVYRQILSGIIKKDDVVVELGCHVGNSTRIIEDLSPEGTLISLGQQSRICYCYEICYR